MYLLFLALLFVEIGLWFLVGYAQAQASAALASLGLLSQLLLIVLRGWYGNRWVQASLIRRGYQPRSG